MIMQSIDYTVHEDHPAAKVLRAYHKGLLIQRVDVPKDNKTGCPSIRIDDYKLVDTNNFCRWESDPAHREAIMDIAEKLDRLRGTTNSVAFMHQSKHSGVLRFYNEQEILDCINA